MFLVEINKVNTFTCPLTSDYQTIILEIVDFRLGETTLDSVQVVICSKQNVLCDPSLNSYTAEWTEGGLKVSWNASIIFQGSYRCQQDHSTSWKNEKTDIWRLEYYSK